MFFFVCLSVEDFFLSSCPCDGRCDACKLTKMTKNEKTRGLSRHISFVNQSNFNSIDGDDDVDGRRPSSKSLNAVGRGRWVRSRVMRYEDREILSKFNSPFKVYPLETFSVPKDLTECSASFLETEEFIL